MGDSYTEKAKVSNDIIRSVFAFLDRPAYWLLGIVYQLFFNVASADLFSNDTIMKFYGRVQVILGVFMMFQLAMTILRGIVEPDNFTKEKGAGSLLRRVVISLLLITALMPVNVGNPRNEYEIQLNNNGLLFGTLYSLQYRLLSNNTIGRLVLGTSSESSTFIDSSDDDLETSSKIFTSTVLKAFYRINLKENYKKTTTGDPATLAENRMCDIPSKILEKYTKVDADPGEIISLVNEDCDSDGEKRYMFNYMPFVSTVVALIFVFILLSFTVDVAVRAVKLAVLRLIAPIPLISYMNPSGKGDEAFKAWTKALTTTYLDLFIRLAVVYFVIYLIQDMIAHGVVMNHGSGVIGVLSFILIWIGLFIFAKQAPKFIKEVLGLKGDAGGKLFGGFGEIGAVVGAAAAVPGAIGSGIASARASRLADRERANADPNYNPDSILNRGKHLLSGIAGGVAGGATGVSAAMKAKDHAGRAALDAMAKRNTAALSAGRSGGTFFGAVGSDIGQLVSGESAYDRMEAGWKAEEQRLKDRELALKPQQDEMKRRKDANAHRQAMIQEVNSKADDSLDTRGSYGSITDANYYRFHSAVEAAKTRGVGVSADGQWFEYGGQRIRVSEMDVYDNEIRKANRNNYYEQALAGTIDNAVIQGEGAAYERESGHTIETDFKNLKINTGAEGRTIDSVNAQIAQQVQEINQRRSAINDERQGFRGQSAQSNAQRFKKK
ncbi:MAG: hypothetical protein IKF71_03115 [Bacilli bacterium]|nr:hypothetical protein [Bacilli bacterium]